MSVLDIDNMQGLDLITHYVLECRAKGHFLPYTDHEIITRWLAAAGNSDQLLVILSDILPEFYSKTPSRPRSLKLVNKKVLRRINETVRYLT
jgi:hypothetical protein